MTDLFVCRLALRPARDGFWVVVMCGVSFAVLALIGGLVWWRVDHASTLSRGAPTQDSATRRQAAALTLPFDAADVCAGGVAKFTLASVDELACQTSAVRVLSAVGGRQLMAIAEPKLGIVRVAVAHESSAASLWQIGVSQAGAFQLRNVATGGRLHALWDGQSAGSPVQVVTGDTVGAPNWLITPQTDGRVRVTYWTSGLALAVNESGREGRVQLQAPLAGADLAQAWLLTDVSGRRCQVRAATEPPRGQRVRAFRPEEL